MDDGVNKSFYIFACVVLTVGATCRADSSQMSDDELLTTVQRQSFKYFWDFGHPVSGLSREGYRHSRNLCTAGGTGVGIMTIVVGAQRGFVTRAQAADRILLMLSFLQDNVTTYHGVWPHWFWGDTGRTVPFSTKDDGGDIVETAFLVQGILTARQYFDRAGSVETEIRQRATQMWESVEWDWHLRRSQPGYEDSEVMYWHWSPNYGWDMNMSLKGYYEAMIVYVLGAASPTHPIPASCYFNGWASRSGFTNDGTFYGHRQWVGPDYGGPLFWSHYSFLGLDPRYASDGFCNYYRNNRNTSLIHHAYSVDNPLGFTGYGANCWGLTASTGPFGYGAWSPTNDNGTISPTAAISAIPYTPGKSLLAIRHFYYDLGSDIWAEYGFVDAFNLSENWYADTYLAINQGTINPMIENYRTGLCWQLFMSNPEIGPAMEAIGFINDPYDNMLVNPGFEDGPSGQFGTVEIPGWTQTGTSAWLHPDPGETIGRKTVKVWSNSTGAHQDIAVDDRRSYVVGAYLASFTREPLVNRRAVVRAEWLNGEDVSIWSDRVGVFVAGADPYDEWKYVEANLSPPDGAVKCRVIIAMENISGSAGGVAHFDGLSVVPAECIIDHEGDLNGDCSVDMHDLRLMAQNWLTPYDLSDFATSAADWQK